MKLAATDSFLSRQGGREGGREGGLTLMSRWAMFDWCR